MKLSDLSPTPGSTGVRKRIGRGIGSGTGKTSGKGHKGQNARSGGGVPIWFEGGQMRLTQRVRKRGFTNKFAKSYNEINIESLNEIPAGTIVTQQYLFENGYLAKMQDALAVLGDGELGAKLTVVADRITGSAAQKIRAAGGKVELLLDTNVLEKLRNGSVVTPKLLFERELTSIEADGFHMKGAGRITKSVTVKARSVTPGATKIITSAGGKVEVV